MSKQELPKAYNAQDWEDALYQKWLESGFFNPDVCIEKGVTKPDAEPFSMVLPPPNATGTLHTGSACMLAIEDTLVRFARMQGRRTLWLPGTDHAAIATQSKVERILWEEEAKTRYDLGREALIEKIDLFVQKNQETMQNQMRKMGASLDWSREAFTLDDQRHQAVNLAFKTMYDEGLIVRGDRIVNWDPKGQTTISDDEVVYQEETAKLYYLKYGPFEIATARPETKFGDKYVVMHPDDTRYAEYTHGQTIELDWINDEKIEATIIKDDSIDMDFGTGVMTITPWHSMADFDIAERHGLDKEQIIDQTGKLLPIAGEFAGLHIRDAREKIVAKLKSKGLVTKVEDAYTHQIATAERTGETIEPQIMRQWFILVNKEFERSGKLVTLKSLMQNAVAGGDIAILPERFRKTYFQWIDNLRDWCISRQIWYGHRIPAYYDIFDDQNSSCIVHFKLDLYKNETFLKTKNVKKFCEKNEIESWGWITDSNGSGEISAISFKNLKTLLEKDTVTIEKIREEIQSIDLYYETPIVESSTQKLPPNVIQDPDTLDTWFSSGLWTFSTLGWGADEEQWQREKIYHPTTLIETGYDILFFWIARMVLMSQYLLDEVPFRTIYLHGLVRDAEGRKMSKSLDNIIDPLEVIKDYGTDALRLALISGNTPGNDARLSDEKLIAQRNFVNKLWNMSRYVFLLEETALTNDRKNSLADEYILMRLNTVTESVTTSLESYQLSFAVDLLRDFTVNSLADWYIEIHKIEKNDAVLKHVMTELIKLWHPFMPFVTEAIWTHFDQDDLLLVTKWPQKTTDEDPVVIHAFESIQTLVTRVRNIRATYRIGYKTPLEATVFTANSELFASNRVLIEKMSSLNFAVTTEEPGEITSSIRLAEADFTLYLNLKDIIDFSAEQNRLIKELAETEKFLSGLSSRLDNPNFRDNAPTTVIEAQEKTRAEMIEKITTLQTSLEEVQTILAQ